jgi:hypothetical protein
MSDHNGFLVMQRMLLAGTLGLAMARKAAAILEGGPSSCTEPSAHEHLPAQAEYAAGNAAGFREPEGADGAVLRAILDAANDCLGHFDDRPPAERWCDTLFHLLDLAAFAAEISDPAST